MEYIFNLPLVIVNNLLTSKISRSSSGGNNKRYHPIKLKPYGYLLRITKRSCTYLLSPLTISVVYLVPQELTDRHHHEHIPGHSTLRSFPTR